MISVIEVFVLKLAVTLEVPKIHVMEEKRGNGLKRVSAIIRGSSKSLWKMINYKTKYGFQKFFALK